MLRFVMMELGTSGYTSENVGLEGLMYIIQILELFSIQYILLNKIIMKSEEIYGLNLIYFFVYTEWALLGILIPVILLFLDAG